MFDCGGKKLRANGTSGLAIVSWGSGQASTGTVPGGSVVPKVKLSFCLREMVIMVLSLVPVIGQRKRAKTFRGDIQYYLDIACYAWMSARRKFPVHKKLLTGSVPPRRI